MVISSEDYFEETSKETTKDSFYEQKDSTENKKYFEFPSYGSIKAKAKVIGKLDVKK